MKSSCRKFFRNDDRLIKRSPRFFPYTLRILSSLLFLCLFLSCEKDIAFSGKIIEPQLVVNSYIAPDSFMVAQVTESRFFLDNKDTFKIVENADVQLFADNIFKEKMAYTNNGFYYSSYTPKAGETIRLDVAAPGLKTVTCETEVQKQTEILSLDTTFTLTESIPETRTSYNDFNKVVIDTIGYRNYYTINFTLKFKDTAESANYYRIDLKKGYSQYGVVSSLSNVEFDFSDIVSGKSASSETDIFDGSNSSNSYNIFSDEIFNGKEYPLKFKIKDYSIYYPVEKSTTNIDNPEDFKIELQINLQAISKDYYLYLKSRSASENNSFLSEPVQIYNNVENGIGILGSFTNNIVKMELPF